MVRRAEHARAAAVAGEEQGARRRPAQLAQLAVERRAQVLVRRVAVAHLQAHGLAHAHVLADRDRAGLLVHVDAGRAPGSRRARTRAGSRRSRCPAAGPARPAPARRRRARRSPPSAARAPGGWPARAMTLPSRRGDDHLGADRRARPATRTGGRRRRAARRRPRPRARHGRRAISTPAAGRRRRWRSRRPPAGPGCRLRISPSSASTGKVYGSARAARPRRRRPARHAGDGRPRRPPGSGLQVEGLGAAAVHERRGPDGDAARLDLAGRRRRRPGRRSRSAPRRPAGRAPRRARRRLARGCRGPRRRATRSAGAPPRRSAARAAASANASTPLSLRARPGRDASGHGTQCLSPARAVGGRARAAAPRVLAHERCGSGCAALGRVGAAVVVEQRVHLAGLLGQPRGALADLAQLVLGVVPAEALGHASCPSGSPRCCGRACACRPGRRVVTASTGGMIGTWSPGGASTQTNAAPRSSYQSSVCSSALVARPSRGCAARSPAGLRRRRSTSASSSASSCSPGRERRASAGAGTAPSLPAWSQRLDRLEHRVDQPRPRARASSTTRPRAVGLAPRRAGPGGSDSRSARWRDSSRWSFTSKVKPLRRDLGPARDRASASGTA